ncbi:hypothetical protein ACWEV9_10750 [Streptomyces albogriseolus]|uniref:hypothetical protein n=1 Tax=Streptomyces albogriseolus TaxID=1887 RepID=UPI003460F3A7
MAERPTTNWRRSIAEEAAKLVAGTLDPDCACMVELFPEELLLETHAVLDVFEAEWLATSTPSKPTNASSCAPTLMRRSPSAESTSRP